MKASWLFESDTFGEGIAQFVEEVERQGMEAKYAAKVPMRTSDTYLNIYPPGACVVFYGSLGFSRQIQKEASWVPGTFHSYKNFFCSAYYPHFKQFLLASSNDYIFTDFGQLTLSKEFLFEKLGQKNTLFVRPDSGEKIFTGRLINYEDLEKILPQLGYEDIPENEVVVVSSPVNIDKEWRFVVANDEVITGSLYLPFRLRLSDRQDDQKAREFAQKVVDSVGWRPDPMWCLDVCLTESGNYYVIEINSFSCSGFYACNPKPIVTHASETALRKWKEAYP